MFSTTRRHALFEKWLQAAKLKASEKTEELGSPTSEHKQDDLVNESIVCPILIPKT